MATAEDRKQWYDANCHCRRVQLRVNILPLYAEEKTEGEQPGEVQKPIDCNCSICTKNGYLNVYPDDQEKDIEWVSGKDDLKVYQFGTKAVDHKFCPDCGSTIVLLTDTSKFKKDGKVMTGINVRMIKDIDISKLTLHKLDGASWNQSYEK